MKRLAVPTLLGLAAAVALALPGAASAAPCPNNLTVAGIPVTGADCVDAGGGAVEINTPQLLSGQAVQILGKMILNQPRTQMVQSSLVAPTVVTVQDSVGGFLPVIGGQVTVGSFEICDLFGSLSPFDGTVNLAVDNATATAGNRLSIQGSQVSCHTGPALTVGAPVIQGALKLLKLAASTNPIFKLDNSGSVALPTTFGLDETRGGRLYGNFTASVPLPGRDRTMGLGLTAEVSKNEGFKPISVGGVYNGRIVLLPGVTINDPAVLIDSTNQTLAGRLKLGFPPRLIAAGAQVLVQDGSLKNVSLDVGLGSPGFSLGGIKIQSVSATLNGSPFGARLLFGGTTQLPGSLEGQVSFTGGPSIPLASGTFPALVGNLAAKFQGTTLQLAGTLKGINNLLTLAQAFVLIGANPFRFEADATLSFPNPSNPAVLGSVFLGVTASAFTGLGTLRVRVPSQVPVIGGKEIGGFSGVVSDKALAATIVIDAPLVQPRTLGLAFKYRGGFDVIDSTTPFITVTPTHTLSARAAASAATRARFRVRRARHDVAIEITGKRARPSRVAIRRAGGRKLKTVKLPSAQRKVLTLAVKRLPRGRYVVTGRGIAKVVVGTIDPAPFLQPAAGFGTRPNPPVSAGTPVKVCWDIKHAPKRAAVDLFEDTNGFAATGRDIATGLKAKACYQIPTTDWEPGRHWVYGIVRSGDRPLSARYWPIGITITDATRLAAPGSLAAAPAPDGAHVTWDPVEGATGYQVKAVPVDPQDAPEHRAIAFPDAAPSADIMLRGAERWTVSVQAIGDKGELGNVSQPIVTGATDPVVLAGRPNGTPRVGERWAFKLKTRNLATLKIVSAPPGTKLDAAAGLVTWTPSAKAGRLAPQKLELEGCAADGRCFSQAWNLTAFAEGLAPAGPARSFRVLDSVVRPGQKVELRAQGIVGNVTAKVDGVAVKTRKLDEQTVAITLSRKLAKGAHSVSLRIGQGLEESLSGALVRP